MALLKRLKASTLMETMVATVLIVVIFMISSMVLNNLLVGNVAKNTEIAQERLHALEYQYKNKGLKLPYYEDYEAWEISVVEMKKKGRTVVFFEAENQHTKASVSNFVSGGQER